jgi:hypothetical protein
VLRSQRAARRPRRCAAPAPSVPWKRRSARRGGLSHRGRPVGLSAWRVQGEAPVDEMLSSSEGGVVGQAGQVGGKVAGRAGRNKRQRS